MSLVPQQATIRGAVTRRPIWQRIGRDVALLGAGSIAVVVAQLAFRTILIAALLPSAYGQLTLILSVYNTVWIVGASGLPNSVAKYIATITPADDSAIVRSAIRASMWPVLSAAIIVGATASLLLHSTLAFVLAVAGLSSLVYSLLAMGILRGRGRVGAAAAIMPVGALAEVGPLAILWASGIGIGPLSAFGVFCAGNVVGLIVSITLVKRTAPGRASITTTRNSATPTPRELLGFSIWLGVATAAVAGLPLFIRWAAALHSYTVVAVVDVALTLFAIPQRLGTLIVLAVVPHASRAVNDGNMDMTISRRANYVIVLPFIIAAAIVAFTPVVGSLFRALGRPVYAVSADYLALALLAGPARILYGAVEGVLVAHGEGRYLGMTAAFIAIIASLLMVIAIELAGITMAFAVFVAAYWAIYLAGLLRANHIAGRAIR
jgi:O-antigen/teichoic acid export membrane protein